MRVVGTLSSIAVIWAAVCLMPLLADTTNDSAQVIDTSVSDAEALVTALDNLEEPLYPLSAERYEKLLSYSRFNHIWRFVSFLVGVATLGIILFTGLSARFRTRASRLKRRFFVIWGFMILVIIADYILGFPAHIYRGFIIEKNYGFMNQTFFEWWGDDLLGLLISMILGIIPMWLFYKIVNKFKRWWLIFSIVAVPLSTILIVISPVFISPLFNDYVPLEDKALQTEILDLADRASIEGSDIFQVDGSRQSSKVSAYVTGLLGTKRIVLYDTLIDNFTYDEIKFVMGHEMGHYVMNHIWQGLGLAVFFIMFTLWLINRTIHSVIRRFKVRFGFDSLGDIASLPLVLLFATVIMFFGQPITNGFSRYLEHQADHYAMDITDVSGETAAVAFDKLSVLNLSDPDPHPFIEFWFYNHPTLNKRIAFVRGYER